MDITLQINLAKLGIHFYDKFMLSLKSKTIVVSFVVFCVATLVSCSQQTPRFKPLTKDATIVAFGDSLTFGIGSQQQFSYPAVLQKLIKRKVINAGVPGETTSQALHRLPAIIKEHKPQLVIVCIGGNDMLHRVPIHMIETNITTLIKQLQAQDIQLILLAVPEAKLLPSPAPFYKTIAAQHQVPLINNILTNLIRNRKYKSDRIHLNRLGNQKLAEKIAAFLQKHGAL